MDSDRAGEQPAASDPVTPGPPPDAPGLPPTPGLPPAPTMPPAPPGEPTGLAVASLVLGILATVLSFLLIGGVLGLLGGILGIVHLRRHYQAAALAKWGVCLSLLGVLLMGGFGFLYYRMYLQFREIMTAAGQGAATGGASLDQWQGTLAPDFSVTTLDGQTVRLSDLRGKRVILDFWATWCGPCVQMIPHLNQLAAESSPDEVVILGISDEDSSTLSSFVKKHSISYPIAAASNLPAPYGEVDALPTTFVIDRKGVIQSVTTGSHSLTELRSYAGGADYQGTPKSKPVPPRSGLRQERPLLKPVVAWSKGVSGATAMAVGDWEGDGVADLLVADRKQTLQVFRTDGHVVRSLPLPDVFTLIECGRHKQQGLRLAGYTNWGRKVTVMDRMGQELWTYAAGSGVNGAHWGDLDGDGTDELIVGMNGFGGLHAVSESGKLLWKDTGIGNVWNQAVISALQTGELQKAVPQKPVPQKKALPNPQRSLEQTPQQTDKSPTKRAALVFATEAGGTIQVFDAGGRRLRTLQPLGQYYSQMSAAVTDAGGTVQVIAIGGGQAVALDQHGKVAWQTPSVADHGSWRHNSFASGDLNGDGTQDWVFAEASGSLVVASARGDKLASLPGQQQLSSFVVVPGLKGKGMLITLTSGMLRAYSFK